MIELTLAMAERAVRAAQDKAKALGTGMTVTVVDEAGRLVLSARGDGTSFLSPETSRAKATAAANFRAATAELAKRA
jgi:glc operon protein GlcG